MTPLAIETPQVLYDLSRLVRSINKPFGTGVDRIDLAIGLDLVDRFGDRCHFIHAGLHGVRRLRAAEGRSVLSHLDQAWNGGTGRALAAKQATALSLRSWLGRRLDNFSDLAVADTTYVVASHSGLGKVKGALRRIDPQARMRRLVYIHDLIPIDYPEYQRPETLPQFSAYLDQLLDAPARIVTNSADTARRVAAYSAQRRYPITGTDVVIPHLTFRSPPSSQIGARVRAVMDDPRPLFVTLGTIEPRKNHLLLLHIWRVLAEQGEPPRLCIIGKRGWENENVVDILERCSAVSGHVLEFGSLSDEEVQALLRHSRALLFPSFAEGLGIPLLEAAALGVPAIVSDLPVFHEIAPEGTVFLSPVDGLGWMREIETRAKGEAAARQELQA
ncbi:glycosyltransferase family 4 protein [Rhizobium sp. YIM 134829]|uniref:glycosyltransferase family 4 protein n=1 Tax=Rhizobium sp. YIM 134829 TaxID=3390453 RepID=UPI0039787050